MTIILALLAALLGPMFIDWTAYRASFETEASHILGHPVSVRGTADARLLPYPTLTFTNVVIGEDPKAPLMTVGAFNMEIELFPLLSGEFRVTEMHVVKPELNVRIAGDGTVEWIPAQGRTQIDPGKVILNKVDIEDGSLTVDDARRTAPVRITDVNARLDARSLLGPYKVDGTLKVDGDGYTVKAATGSGDESGRVPLKGTIVPDNRPVLLALDGAVETKDRRPIWKGKGTLNRVIAKDDRDTLPWNVDADLEISSAQVLAKSLQFQYGAEDRPFSMSGAATLDLQAETPSFDAVLSARQIDLDRTLGSGPDAPVDLTGALSALSTTLSDLPVPPIAGRIGFDVPGVVVGGSVMSDLRLDVTSASRGWTIETLEATLPGHTSLAAHGRLDTQPAVSFHGDMKLASDQPSTLVSWWYPAHAKTALDAFSLSASMEASAEGLSLNQIVASQKDGKLTGALSFLPGGPAALRPRITLSLEADRLDEAQVEAVSGLFAGTDGKDGAGPDVVLQAAVGSLIAGNASAEGLDVSASLVDGTLDIDRLFVRSLAGARVSMAGTVKNISTVPDGSVQLRLSAEKMDGVADLVHGLWPDARVAPFLTAAAPFLSPVSLEATVLAKAAGEGTDVRLEAKGNLASTTLAGNLAFTGRVDSWDAANVSLDFNVNGPDGADLMRQFGLDVPKVGAAGVGSLTVSAMGKPKDGLAVVSTVRMGPTDAKLNGSVTLQRNAKPAAELDLDLKSPDVGPLLALTGNVMQGVMATTPVDISAHLSNVGGKLRIQRLTGKASDVPLSGELVLDRSADVPVLSGNLAFDSASLASLAEAALGPGVLDFPIVESRSPWPEAPFGNALLDGFDTDLSLAFTELSISDQLAAHDARLSLRSSASGIAFDGISAKLAGGDLGGNLEIKSDLDGSAALSGTLKLAGASTDELVWQRDGRPVARGRLGIDAQVNATGRTIAGWMASLSGGGSVAIEDGSIASMNTRAFSSVVRTADSGKELSDDAIRQLFQDNVDVGDLAFSRLDATFTLTSGTLRAPSIVVQGGASETSASATVDLPHMSLQSEWRLAPNAADFAVSGGAVPQVSVLFSGPLDTPRRKIDVTALTSYLGIRNLEKETERVLLMQADILERELLTRTVQRDREALAHDIRLAAEAKARSEAEAAARKALEEQAPPPADGKKAAAGNGTDDFATQILNDLKKHQPAAPGSKLPPLPGVNVGPPPGGTTSAP
ncbi:AsmA family protein [Oryzibacter oryziterrae]|uniref:AsmA family protein n=1 Tax=Oryzibacter oryziterrae TaxID=2766474 RepID=UPI001F1638D5|nr:AsmA-like C-terminal region-containing protein [Oryzibacter oryziterrae]